MNAHPEKCLVVAWQLGHVDAVYFFFVGAARGVPPIVAPTAPAPELMLNDSVLWPVAFGIA